MLRRRVCSLRVSRKIHKRNFVRYSWPDTLSVTPTVQKSTLNHRYLPPKTHNSHKTLEEQRRKIIVLERHVLETAAFDFRSQHPQPYIIKFTKYMNRTLSPSDTHLTHSPPRNSPSSLEHRPRRLPHLRTPKTPPTHPRPSLHPPLHASPPPAARHPAHPLPIAPRTPRRRRRRHDRFTRLVYPSFSHHARRATVCVAEVYEFADWHSEGVIGGGGGQGGKGGAGDEGCDGRR